MLYLSPLLICLSSNILLFIITSLLKTNKITLNKASVISTSILLTLIAFISMELGELSSIYLFKDLSNIFGGILLLFIGINYLTEHKRKIEYNNGLDTSFYYETFPKFRHLFLNPSLLDKNNSNCIELNESIYISIPISLLWVPVFFAAGITSVNISFTLFFLFLSTTLLLSINSYRKETYFSTILSSQFSAIIGVLLILSGILEIII